MGSASPAAAGIVKIKQNQLYIDGRPQPQLWGAEIQYFRLRGGSGANVPRDQVIETWKRALDYAVAAKMNAVSFYIPWDFHEYAEGKFDFDGTADEDHDGRADYPSRDVHTFIHMIQERGIRHIMARPGPFINAEWGFLGFGAVPLWFHEKLPDSHARNNLQQRTTLYSYHDPDFLLYSRRWLETVYQRVLRPYIGKDKPISFIQVDNETNFMWQSIYNHDYGPRAVRSYQDFLRGSYSSLTRLNQHHQRNWGNWREIQPPTRSGLNIAEDQDWYRFQDLWIYSYLRKIRNIWNDLGVREPTVLFTLAESYNAAENGLLPHYHWRNSRDTGMMTVNLYPKTYETSDQTLLNLPFKADHDVKAADAASDFYLGRKEQWAMGPEIQGGWWRGIHVSEEARRQTYLTTLGHGLKALFIYYFTEGENWQHDWMKKAITPAFNRLRGNERYRDLPDEQLPDAFWRELDADVARHLLVVDTRFIWKNGGTQPERLYFDAPLAHDAQPRAPYRLIKEIGEKIIAPYGEFLAQAVALEDNVCVVKDSAAHVPSSVAGVNSRVVQSDWAGGLLALLMHAGVNAKVVHWGLNPKDPLMDPRQCQLIVYQDTGFASNELVATLEKATRRGVSILSFIHSDLANRVLARHPGRGCQRLPASPIEVQGYRCELGSARLFYAKVPIYDVFNTDFYYLIHDVAERRAVVENILRDIGVTPSIRIKEGADRTVAFARVGHDRDQLWITLKTSRLDGFAGHLQWTRANPRHLYRVIDVLAGTSVEITGERFARDGFAAAVGASGSAAYFVSSRQRTN